MGRLARTLLVLVALAVVFAPRALAPATHDGPRLLTAAVLAPTTGDGDAVSPAREREAAPTVLLVAVLVVLGTLVLAPGPRRRATGDVVARTTVGSDPRPRRRGPPRTFA